MCGRRRSRQPGCTAYPQVVPVRVLLASLAVLLLAPAAAAGALADEQRQGRELASQLQAGTKACDDLSPEDFDHISEYVMGSVLGSAKTHQAMNDRMRLMMGKQTAQRMHQVMGRRYAGCHDRSSNDDAYGMSPGMMSDGRMGPGTMGGYYGDDGWDAMMRSGDWSWMESGNWRSMSRQDWERVQQQWLGTTATKDGGWSPWAIIAITLAGITLAALAVFAIIRRPPRRPPAQPSPS